MQENRNVWGNFCLGTLQKKYQKNLNLASCKPAYVRLSSAIKLVVLLHLVPDLDFDGILTRFYCKCPKAKLSQMSFVSRIVDPNNFY